MGQRWASDGPRSREDFLKTFPTNGFCLVGRALGPKNNNLVRTALTTMLNEYLDRGSARRFVAIAPTSVLENTDGRRFLEEAIVASRSEAITVDTIKGRRAATVLAFGVEPTPLTEERFRSFCAELLSDNGWRISSHSRDKEFILATIDQTKQQVLFGVLVVPTSIKNEADMFFEESSTAKSIPDYMITNARPPHRQKAIVGKHKIEILHYSVIPELTRQIRSSRQHDTL
jgi:hypothetical protein